MTRIDSFNRSASFIQRPYWESNRLYTYYRLTWHFFLLSRLPLLVLIITPAVINVFRYFSSVSIWLPLTLEDLVVTDIIRKLMTPCILRKHSKSLIELVLFSYSLVKEREKERERGGGGRRTKRNLISFLSCFISLRISHKTEQTFFELIIYSLHWSHLEKSLWSKSLIEIEIFYSFFRVLQYIHPMTSMLFLLLTLSLISTSRILRSFWNVITCTWMIPFFFLKHRQPIIDLESIHLPSVRFHVHTYLHVVSAKMIAYKRILDKSSFSLSHSWSMSHLIFFALFFHFKSISIHFLRLIKDLAMCQGFLPHWFENNLWTKLFNWRVIVLITNLVNDASTCQDS